MILQNRTRSISRRSAFTLLEVLVVVAIILVLASVATVAVLQVQEDNKDSTAKINAVNLAKSVQVYMLRNDGNKPNGWEDVLRYIEGQDISKTIDPWNNPYQIGYSVSDTGVETAYVWTTNPKTQAQIRSDAKH